MLLLLLLLAAVGQHRGGGVFPLERRVMSDGRRAGRRVALRVWALEEDEEDGENQRETMRTGEKLRGTVKNYRKPCSAKLGLDNHSSASAGAKVNHIQFYELLFSRD